MFFHWESFYGKLITFATKSKWTHVGIGIENGDNYIVYEALSKGLVKSVYSKQLIDNWTKNGTVTTKTYNSPKTKKHILGVCESYIGEPYDWTAIFSIGLYFIFGEMAIDLWTGPKKVICSEFVARVLYDISNKKINFEKEYSKPFDMITPADIYNSVQLKK